MITARRYVGGLVAGEYSTGARQLLGVDQLLWETMCTRQGSGGPGAATGVLTGEAVFVGIARLEQLPYDGRNGDPAFSGAGRETAASASP